MGLKSYIAIARPSHWFKNLFMLPGAAFAALLAGTGAGEIVRPVLLALASASLAASANYVLNEWLDAEFDRYHPLKKDRPSVIRRVRLPMVLLEYAVLAAAGLLLAYVLSVPYLVVTAAFLIMGVVYNLRPIRTKDVIYLDVLSESVNNPIRLLLGWLAVEPATLPPSSLVLGYWMGGAFLMAIKRYAEYRFLNNADSAALYRRSFRHYTQEKLLVSAFLYAMCSAFFLGVFLVKYRLELLLSLPLFGGLFAWYFHLGLKPNSVVQRPEDLWRETPFMIYVALLTTAVALLLVVDLPWMARLLETAFITIP